MPTHDNVSQLKRTPLYEQHRELGARLVDFSGWEMPVQYSSILEEHEAVRTRAGLFDVSHMGEFKVEGKKLSSSRAMKAADASWQIRSMRNCSACQRPAQSGNRSCSTITGEDLWKAGCGPCWRRNM